MENKQQFIELVQRYETITLSEIQDEWHLYGNNPYVHDVASALTGFGSRSTCTLCKPISGECKRCVYGKSSTGFGCINIKNSRTYDKIENATSAEELLEAFRNRAKHMRENYTKVFEDEL